MPVDAYVTETAVHKAKETTFDVIIGCDTVVSIDGLIIGKPRDNEDAYETIKRLSGREHSVFSGVALIDSKQKMEKFHEETVVEFGDIPDSVIRNYVDTGEPTGAAGSYRIQGKGAVFVQQVRGNYPNVVGLPIFELVKRLRLILRK
ncbi:maf protein [Aphelenchoides avenae]|nr:maf protein [Aphelenchus avenae]